MTEPPNPPGPRHHDAPPIPRLGPAATHLAAAEEAARRRDFGTAVRERFRAVTRGLEQRGVLEVRRARTARVTADDASTALGARGELADPTELPSAAHNFDEIVYGGRPATEDEYRRLAQADRFSIAPPPVDEPAEITERRRKPRRKTARTRRRRLPNTPALLRDWRFWAVLAGTVAVALLTYLLLATPTPSPPQTPELPTQPPAPPTQEPIELPPPRFGEGKDSLFERLPGWVAFGGLQWAIAWAILLWWRGRRRGSIVTEPLPVRAPANELLTGQAGLYRKSRDYEHIAGKLRSASLRRLRPTLGLTADATPDRISATVTARGGVDPAVVAAALYDPVPDRGTLELVAAQLEWIEAEVL
ncbi:DUF4129 domain-containing protein [Nocardia uniformis]|uniref:DUF4129 domain-containing protein n=1 Tax=Nocardia uniformis TaxID=53432 RepID=A0A849CC73_9NOCA|nr:DUF4129 domain-containing protein [Nocardia uniformis]NNH73980.1 DUF4129 domain-containing protein [Nocardia uniformis]